MVKYFPEYVTVYRDSFDWFDFDFVLFRVTDMKQEHSQNLENLWHMGNHIRN